MQYVIFYDIQTNSQIGATDFFNQLRTCITIIIERTALRPTQLGERDRDDFIGDRTKCHVKPTPLRIVNSASHYLHVDRTQSGSQADLRFGFS